MNSMTFSLHNIITLVKNLVIVLLLSTLNCHATALEKIPTINKHSFNQIQKIQKEIDAEKFPLGLELIHNYLAKKTITNYEKALGLSLRGYLFYSAGRLPESILVYREILQADDLPNTLELNTRRTLCQLLIANSNYEEAFLEIITLEKILPASDAALLALKSRVFLAKQDYHAALKTISRAIKENRAENIVPKEDWLHILYVCLFQEKEYEKMVEALIELLETYPKHRYALDLANGYGLIQKSRSHLIILESLNEIQPFSKPALIKALANLHLLHGAPYKAATILQFALNEQILKQSEENLRLLGYAWLIAKETSLAVQPFAQAATLSSNGNLHLQLAQLSIDQEQWKEAAHWIEKGLEKGNLKSTADANIMLGISLFNQHKIKEARIAFIKAMDSGQRVMVASRWIEHIGSD